MNSSTSTTHAVESEVRSLYQKWLDGWNKRKADEMAELMAEDGELIGFDGSHYRGRAETLANLSQIFSHHPTPPYVGKVKSVRVVGPGVAVLHAIVGMVPPGQADIVPALNAHQTLVAIQSDGQYRITLFQNTPAQFHGRPELVQEMSDELRQLLT